MRRYLLAFLAISLLLASMEFRSYATQDALAQTASRSIGPDRSSGMHENFFKGAERELMLESRDRILEIRSRHSDKLWSLPGVIGVGTGLDTESRRLVIVVTIDKDKPVPEVPSSIEGVPVRVEQSEILHAINGGEGCVPCHHELEGKPVEMGNSFSEGYAPPNASDQNICGACTMGFKAYKIQDGSQVFLTNAHCQRGVNKPGCPGDKPTSGIDAANYHPALPDHSLANGCLLAALDSVNVGNSKSIILQDSTGANLDAAMIESDPSLTSFNIRDIGAQGPNPGIVMPGDVVQKSGRTTGHTSGSVSTVDAQRSLDYDCRGSMTFSGLITWSSNSDCDSPPCVAADHGDSGSGLFDGSSPVKVVGLNFAANPNVNTCAAFPVQRVLDAFILTLNPNHTGDCRDIVRPTVTTFDSEPGFCGGHVNYDVDYVGDCGNTLSCVPAPGDFFPVGTKTVTCESPNGFSNKTFTITVRNNGVKPLMTLPSDFTQSTDQNSCAAVVSYTATARDDCAGVNLDPGCSPASGSTFQKGTTTVTCSATNLAGTTTRSFSVTVADVQAPAITCSSNLTKGTDAGHCYATTNYTVSASDNCDGSLTPTCTPASGSNFQKGTTTVSCNVHDAANNSSDCSFTVTVNDTQAPTVTCPGNLARSTDTNSCSALVPYTASANDNCDGSLTPSCTPAPGSSFQKGTTTVNCTITDSSSNTSNCSFTVTVNDTQAPTITCSGNVTKNTDPNSCAAVVSFSTTATDNCDAGLTPTCTPASGTSFQKGTTSVSCTVKDSSNNSSNCSFSVTVNDTQAPSISCAGNIVKPVDPNVCTTTVAYATPTVSDNCPGLGAPTCTPASGSVFSKGTTTVNCSVRDAANNPSACAFTVSVIDTQAPSIACPQNLTVPTAPNLCSAMVSYGAPAVGDNCPGVGAPVCSPPSGSTFPKGTTTIACSVTDASKNQANCSFSVTVIDTQPPSLGCPASFNAVAVASCPFATNKLVTYPAPAFSDNCPGATASCNPASGSVLPAGTTTVTCTAVDSSGNTTNCSFRVNVFSFCLQDDSQPGNFVLINAMTGEYAFYCNGAVVATGTGGLTVRGCIASIDHNKGDRRVHVQWDTTAASGRGAGTAIVQLGTNNTKCQVTDHDMSNNSCSAVPTSFDGK